MNILIYADPTAHRAERCFERVREMVPHPITFVACHRAFRAAFTRCLSGETIVVFFVSDEKDRAFLEVMEGTLVGVRLIIHLTARTDDLVGWAHRFRPGIVTSSEDDPDLLPLMIRNKALKMNRVIGDRTKNEQEPAGLGRCGAKRSGFPDA